MTGPRDGFEVSPEPEELFQPEFGMFLGKIRVGKLPHEEKIMRDSPHLKLSSQT